MAHNGQWGGKRPGAGRPRTGKTISASKTEQQRIIRATLIFANVLRNFPDNLEGAYRATKQALIDEGESEQTAVQIAGAIAETFQTPYFGGPKHLAEEVAPLLDTLTPQREPVAAIYRRLGWTRAQVEQTITKHRAMLERNGMRLHVATHSEASGRMEKYITIDGTRYSHISRE